MVIPVTCQFSVQLRGYRFVVVLIAGKVGIQSTTGITWSLSQDVSLLRDGQISPATEQCLAQHHWHRIVPGGFSKTLCHALTCRYVGSDPDPQPVYGWLVCSPSRRFRCRIWTGKYFFGCELLPSFGDIFSYDLFTNRCVTFRLVPKIALRHFALLFDLESWGS